MQKLSAKAKQTAFRYRMKNLARVHKNPRFLKIHLHIFRHCKALGEHHRTRDILHVKMVLGHRSINTTMRYVELYKQLYSNDGPNQFITKIASTKKDRCILINDGWDLVDKDGEDWYFRKLK